MMNVRGRSLQKTPSSGLSMVAQLFGITAIVLMLVWLLHYGKGFDLNSNDPTRIFNLHPLLMFCGFIFMAGEAMMVYRTVKVGRPALKLIHMTFQLIALGLGVVGIYAAFKFHKEIHLSHMTSLHAWIGIATYGLFLLQFLFGLPMVVKSRPDGEISLPWHVCFGRMLFYMAICTAISGLMQKQVVLKLKMCPENSLINFTAAAILLFGIAVELSISLPRFV
uniref:ascorbate ferrireductase (transmembrane) n=1 Tax=Kalanchoe fedtschenkoi TaxID=63787 RepID=A0A7N1A8H1_KALFE